MKKYILLSLLTFVALAASAKKVKFAVDMDGLTISPTGVHVSGTFQKAAGYPEDLCSDCTPLIQEGSTSIYSIVVNIPAFNKYYYRFLNGDQFYEAEFVPVESRVGYDDNDDRWLYVDSLRNDTTFVGAILFAGNAPANSFLVRFAVDLQKQNVDAKGVHLAGDFQLWNINNNILYHFEDAPAGKYEVISYLKAGTYQYKYYNGNALTNSETVPGTCALNGNRSITVNAHTVLNTVCFSKCEACDQSGIDEHKPYSRIRLYPNPTANECHLFFSDSPGVKSLVISDALGKVIRNYESINSDSFIIKKENLQPGLYFIHVLHASKAISTEKLIIE